MRSNVLEPLRDVSSRHLVPEGIPGAKCTKLAGPAPVAAGVWSSPPGMGKRTMWLT